MDRNSDESISFKEFIVTFLKTYCSNLHTLLSLAFEMYTAHLRLILIATTLITTSR